MECSYTMCELLSSVDRARRKKRRFGRDKTRHAVEVSIAATARHAAEGGGVEVNLVGLN